MKRLLLLCLDKGTWVLTQCPAIYSRRCVVGYEAKHPSKMNGAQWVDWHVMVISWWGEVRNRAPHCAINDDEPWFINIPKNMAMTSSTNEDSDDVDMEAWWRIWVMGCKGGTCPPPPPPTWLNGWYSAVLLLLQILWRHKPTTTNTNGFSLSYSASSSRSALQSSTNSATAALLKITTVELDETPLSFQQKWKVDQPIPSSGR